MMLNCFYVILKLSQEWLIFSWVHVFLEALSVDQYDSIEYFIVFCWLHSKLLVIGALFNFYVDAQRLERIIVGRVHKIEVC